MLRKIYKLLGVLLIGFAGGALAPWTLGWIRSATVSTPGDAVSIANTYIVFTTIIFVGITVVLALAGYVLTQQFSATKQSQESQLIDELKDKVKNDEKVGIALANGILDNGDVKRHVDTLIHAKVDELLRAKLSECEQDAKTASRKVDAVTTMAAQLNGSGEK